MTDSVAGGGVEIAGRFVGQQQPGLVNQRSKVGQPLLFAARQPFREAAPAEPQRMAFVDRRG
jgi:hypothetical protein